MKSPTPTKLTLRLDSALIHRAKTYALVQDRSLSQLVADYFAHLTVMPEASGKTRARRGSARMKLGPITTQLRGALRQPGSNAMGGRPLPSRAEHRAHLEEKYR